MQIINKPQRGEITTLLVLLGIGIMALGIVAGKKIVETGTNFLPRAAVPAMTSTPTPTIIDELRAFWNFNEGTGNRVRDRSGHGHGGDWMEDGSDFSDNWVKDKNNLLYAGSFQRAKFSRVRVLDADDLDIRRSLTISAWVYPKTSDQEQGAPILAKGTGGPGMAYVFDFVQRPLGNAVISRNIRFFANSADGNNNNDKKCEVEWLSDQKVNTWSYLSAVYEWKAGDVGKITLYDSDTPLTTCENISSTLISVNTSPITLGSRKSSDSSGFDMNYSGYLDEVRLYNKALTLSEIRNNMNEMIITPTPTVTPTTTLTPTPTVTNTPTPTIPAPTANTATNITSTSFSANWFAPAGATSYKLDVALAWNFTSGFISGCGDTHNLPCRDFDVGDVTSYQVTQSCFDLAPVYYRVRAVNASGTSTNSNVVSVTRIPCAPTILPPPPGSSQSTDSSIVAVWTGSYAATGYYLDVATDSGFNSFVASGCEGSCNNKDVGRVFNYTVIGLSANSTYYYRLRSYNASGTSVNSNTGSRTTTSAITPTPTVTLTPTPTVTLTPTPTVTLTPTPTVTLTPTPTVTLTPTPTVTNTPTPTVTNTPTPTVTLTPTPTITLTPTASVTPNPNAPIGSCETYNANTETTPVTWTWESSDDGLQVYDDTGMWWYNSTATSPITISSVDNANDIPGIPPGRTVYARTSADWENFSPVGQVICPIPSPTITPTPTVTITPTPTLTPTVTPSPTPTLTLTPTPTVTLTPTPTVTLTPTPTLTLTPTPTGSITPTVTITPTPTPVCLKGPNGDLNCDGVVNAIDISILLSHWDDSRLCLTPTQFPTPTFITPAQKYTADIAGDCSVNAWDLSKLLSGWSE